MIKKIALLLVLVLVATCLYTPRVVRAEAFEVDSKISEAVTSKKAYGAIFICNCMKGTEIKNLKISNTKVCVFDNKRGDNNTPVSFDSDGESCSIHIKMTGIGVSYVTGDIYFNGTKVKSFKTKVHYYRYTNPFKKIKLGKMNLKRKFKKKQSATCVPKPRKKLKFSIKLKKGWKLDELSFDTGKKIKNNKKIKMPKKYGFEAIYICLKNKRKKSYESYYLYLEPR